MRGGISTGIRNKASSAQRITRNAEQNVDSPPIVCHDPDRGFFMEVIVLTTFFSVLFAILFLLLFFRVRQNGDSCADQDALLPFLDDEPETAPRATISDSSPSPFTDANQPRIKDDQ